MEQIKFYSTRGKYGCFSNFSKHPVNIDGKRYLTSEHYYQAMKFLDEPTQELIRKQKSAWDAAQTGRIETLPLREDWTDVMDDMMLKALFYKFHQNAEAADVLLSTGNAEIIEDSPTDYYWGCGKDGTGKNMLGKLLMKIRDELKDYVRIEY